MPTRNRPRPASDCLAEPPRLPAAQGERDQQAGHEVEQHRAWRAEQERQAGREDPAESLAEDPHHQAPAGAGQAGDPDGQPDGAAISQAPMPIWIQTAAAPAWTGWNDHVVPAQFTTCCTQPGELAAAGWMTWPGRPAAIAGCACRSPSKIQRMPKPMRSSRRPGGSGWQPRPGSADRAAASRAARRELAHGQPGERERGQQDPAPPDPGAAARRLNAATRVRVGIRLRPEFMPGIGAHPSAPSPAQPGRFSGVDLHAERRDGLVRSGR